MKLLFAMDNFPLYGTSESLEFMKRLRNRGHDVLVCTSSRTINGDTRHGETFDGIRIRYLPSFYIKEIPYVVTPSSPVAISSVIKRYQPDISVCVHLVHFTTNSAVLSSRWNSIPVLLGIRGPRLGFGSSFPNAAKGIWEKSIAKVSIKLSQMIFFDCLASYKSVDETSILSKSVIIYSGVDTVRFAPKAKEGSKMVISFVGSLTPTKGIPYFIMSIPRILQQVPLAEFWIVGDGMLRESLQKLAASIGVSDHVKFLGFRHDIPEILRETDIFVLPSLSEGVSLSLLQAASCGKAIVASDVGGSPEVITDGVDGFLAPVFSGEGIAEKVVKLALNSELREAFGQKVRAKVVRTFDWEPLTDRFEATALCLSKHNGG